MCRFYGKGLNRYYRLCYRKKKRRGEHVYWAETKPDIRPCVNGKAQCVPLRKLPRGRQKSLFPDLTKGEVQPNL